MLEGCPAPALGMWCGTGGYTHEHRRSIPEVLFGQTVPAALPNSAAEPAIIGPSCGFPPSNAHQQADPKPLDPFP